MEQFGKVFYFQIYKWQSGQLQKKEKLDQKDKRGCWLYKLFSSCQPQMSVLYVCSERYLKPLLPGRCGVYGKQLRRKHFAHCSGLTNAQSGGNGLCLDENSGCLCTVGEKVSELLEECSRKPEAAHVILLVLTFAVCPNKTRTCHPCSGLEAKQKQISCRG